MCTWAYIVWIDGIAARAKKVSRICFSSLICLFVFFAFVLLRFLESASEWSNADFRDSDLKGVRNALHMSNSEISSHKPYIKWVWPLEPMTVKWSNYGESLPKMHYVAFIKLMVSQLRCLMNMLNLNDMPLIMIIENAPPKIISKLRLMQMMLNTEENTFFLQKWFYPKVVVFVEPKISTNRLITPQKWMERIDVHKMTISIDFNVRSVFKCVHDLWINSSMPCLRDWQKRAKNNRVSAT